MAKIIFEDMKLNKAKKQPLPKQEEGKALVDLALKNEIKIKHNKISIYPEEKEDISEIKIEEYIKERATPKRISRTPKIRHKTKLLNNFSLYFLILIDRKSVV